MLLVLYEWRNMPKAHGLSPAQLLFGRSQNMFLLQPQAAFSPIDFGQAALARDQLFQSQAEHYNRDKVSLTELPPGQPVRVQNKANGLYPHHTLPFPQFSSEGALHPGSRRSEGRISTTGQIGPSHGLLAAVLPQEGNLLKRCQPQLKPSSQTVFGEESTGPGSNLQQSSDPKDYKVMPRECY